MKKILIIHTGGTIGSESQADQRAMSKDSIINTKRLLLSNFAKSKSRYAKQGDLFVDAAFPALRTTLSESMHPEKLMEIVAHIRSIDLSPYAGVIILHGTDTLAYTAALFSYLFADTRIPMMLVSGNRPPDDERSNANANFKTAVELILEGIAPHVYAVYRNADGIVRLMLGSTLMQSPNYSEDFRSASAENSFALTNGKDDALFRLHDPATFDLCRALSEQRDPIAAHDIGQVEALAPVLLLHPYTGLDYSVYKNIVKEASIRGVVHGTYHSGTVSLPGLVYLTHLIQRQKEAAAIEANGQPIGESLSREIEELKKLSSEEMNSPYSILTLTKACEEQNIPLYIAPSKLGKDQYETMSVVAKEGHVVLLNMTTESAYAKLMVALSCGMTGETLNTYMQTNICREIVD